MDNSRASTYAVIQTHNYQELNLIQHRDPLQLTSHQLPLCIFDLGAAKWLKSRSLTPMPI